MPSALRLRLIGFLRASSITRSSALRRPSVSLALTPPPQSLNSRELTGCRIKRFLILRRFLSFLAGSLALRVRTVCLSQAATLFLPPSLFLFLRPLPFFSLIAFALVSANQFQVLFVDGERRTVLDGDIIRIEVLELSLIHFREDRFVIGKISIIGFSLLSIFLWEILRFFVFMMGVFANDILSAMVFVPPIDSSRGRTWLSFW